LPEIHPSADEHVGPSQGGSQQCSPEGDDKRKARGEEADEAELSRREHWRGLMEGQRQAEELLRVEYEAKLDAERRRVDQLVARVGEEFAGLYCSSEQAVLKFGFGIAERIIRKEVSLDRQMVLEQIKEGVRRVMGVETIKIRVHPGDLALVRGQKSVIQANGDSIREIVVEPDEGLEPGDCILESEMGNIDARVATQLKQIENVLFESKVGI
jgi:flagellar assembly protein FliH